MISTEKQTRVNELQMEDEVEVSINNRTTTEKLLHLLITNNRRKPGWYHLDLCLNLKLEEDERKKVQLNKAEKI